MVEIVRAVSQNSRYDGWLLDEPTSSLSDHEAGAFKVMRKLKSENVAIIYISTPVKRNFGDGRHADGSCLRDGTLVDTVLVSEVTRIKWWQ